MKDTTPYAISAEDAHSVRDLDEAFGTTKFLPEWDQIPESFKRGNDYTMLADCIFFGGPMPVFEMRYVNGFTEQDSGAVNKCVRAHLRSFEPKHQHKIAGVGYMMSCMFEIN